MSASKSIMIFISLALILLLGWMAFRNSLPQASCEDRYPEEISIIKEKILVVENYRKKHGKLPPEIQTPQEVFSGAYYEVLPNGTYQIQRLCFDCGNIKFQESDKRWTCRESSI